MKKTILFALLFCLPLFGDSQIVRFGPTEAKLDSRYSTATTQNIFENFQAKNWYEAYFRYAKHGVTTIGDSAFQKNVEGGYLSSESESNADIRMGDSIDRWLVSDGVMLEAEVVVPSTSIEWSSIGFTVGSIDPWNASEDEHYMFAVDINGAWGDGSSAKWYAMSMSATDETEQLLDGTGGAGDVPITANAIKLKIVVSSGQVLFYADDVLVWTETTAAPAGATRIRPCVNFVNEADTTAHQFDLHYLIVR